MGASLYDVDENCVSTIRPPSVRMSYFEALTPSPTSTTPCAIPNQPDHDAGQSHAVAAGGGRTGGDVDDRRQQPGPIYIVGSI